MRVAHLTALSLSALALAATGTAMAGNGDNPAQPAPGPATGKAALGERRRRRRAARRSAEEVRRPAERPAGRPGRDPDPRPPRLYPDDRAARRRGLGLVGLPAGQRQQLVPQPRRLGRRREQREQRDDVPDVRRLRQGPEGVPGRPERRHDGVRRKPGAGDRQLPGRHRAVRRRRAVPQRQPQRQPEQHVPVRQRLAYRHEQRHAGRVPVRELRGLRQEAEGLRDRLRPEHRRRGGPQLAHRGVLPGREPPARRRRRHVLDRRPRERQLDLRVERRRLVGPS